MIFKTLIRHHFKDIAFYIGLGLALSLLTALSVHAFQGLLDGLADGTLTVGSVAVYGVLITVICILWYVMNIPDSKLSNQLYLDLKVMALHKMSVINYTDYQHMGVGKLIQQIENGAAAGRDILFGFYFRLLRELLPDVVISLIFIALINKTLILFVLPGYVVVFAVTNIVLKRLYKIKSRILINEEWMNHHLIRGLMEMVVFRTNRRFAAEIQKTKEAADTIVSGKTKMLMTHEFFFTLFALLVIFLKIAVLLYALFTKALSVGGIVALMTFLDKAYNPIAIFNVLYVQFKLDRVAFARYAAVLEAPEDAALEQGQRVDITDGAFTFREVCFSYEGKPILQELSLTIRPHAAVALAGESGAGKSTAVKLAAGLLKPSGGTIEVDGFDLSGLALNHYYHFLSYTPQDSPVFNGTLYENIVFDRKVPEADIVQVLTQVQLGDFYQSLPQDLQTEVGERGVLLSGGERQRLALARIFFQPAKIIILDEATSAMDNLTEERVMSHLLEAFRGRTLIVVAHRLSTIRHVDHIFVFKKGQVVEQGHFDALLAQNGYFKELWRREASEEMV